MTALTTFFGLERSTVSWQAIDRGAAYRVIVPSQRSLKSFGRRILSWLRRDPTEDLRTALVHGHARSLRLERDVEDRRRVEQALRVSEERFRTLIEHAPEAIVLYDADAGRFDMVNRNAEEMFGLNQEELLKLGPLDVSPERQPDGVASKVRGEQVILDALAGSTPQFEWVHLNAKGEPILCEVRLVRLPSESRRLLRGSLIDISERKLAAKALSEKEERLRAYVDHSPIGIFVYDEQGRYIDANPAALEMVGYTRDELLARNIVDITDPNYVARGSQAFQLQIATGSNQAEASLLHKSGESIWASIHSVRITDKFFVGFVIDQSESRRAQQILRETENRHRLALDAGLMGTWDWDVTQNRVLWDAREESLLGYAPGEHQGSDRSFFDLIHPDDVPILQAAISNCIESGTSFETEFRVILRNGKQRWLAGRGLVIRDKKGQATRMVGINYDITERKESEAFITDSLREKEAMLKEIHHRVKNNLQVVSSLLNLQAEKIFDPHTRIVLRESQNRVRAMALVHETLYGSESLARIELPNYVERLCDSLIQSFGGSERICVHREISMIDIDLDRALPIGLIIGELVSNAFKYAFPDATDGSVLVAMKIVDSNIELNVRDNGIGLPANLSLDHTETLGLYLVKILTSQLRGELTIDPSGGASFTIRFPK